MSKLKVGDVVRIERRDLPITQYHMIGKITQIKNFMGGLYCFVYNSDWLENSEEDDGSWPIAPYELKIVNSHLVKQKLGISNGQ